MNFTSEAKELLRGNNESSEDAKCLSMIMTWIKQSLIFVKIFNLFVKANVFCSRPPFHLYINVLSIINGNVLNFFLLILSICSSAINRKRF